MNFEEWWEKETGNNENNVIDWKGFCKSAFEAGLHADIHTDNSKVITELEAQIEQLVYLHEEDVNTIKLLNKQIEKMKCCQNCLHYRYFTSDISECAMSFVTSQDCRRKDFYKWESKEKKIETLKKNNEIAR